MCLGERQGKIQAPPFALLDGASLVPISCRSWPVTSYWTVEDSEPPLLCSGPGVLAWAAYKVRADLEKGDLGMDGKEALFWTVSIQEHFIHKRWGRLDCKMP